MERRRWLGLRLGLGLGLGMVTGAMGTTAGCLRVASFQCQEDGDCELDGTPGQCLPAEQVCIYPDTDCDTEWSTANGECMAPAGAGGSDGEASGGSDSSPTSGPPSDTEDTAEPVPRDCQAGPYEDISELGVVWASSVFSDNYHAFLSADRDYSTSWFSLGPEDGGLPSIFRWEVLEPHCVAQITIHGNGLHANPGFRTDYGFESVIVRVYDEADEVIFQEMLGMLGTPDPTLMIEPRVTGVKVELELFEHESNNCGGFSELEIMGF